MNTRCLFFETLKIMNPTRRIEPDMMLSDQFQNMYQNIIQMNEVLVNEIIFNGNIANFKKKCWRHY